MWLAPMNLKATEGVSRQCLRFQDAKPKPTSGENQQHIRDPSRRHSEANLQSWATLLWVSLSSTYNRLLLRHSLSSPLEGDFWCLTHCLFLPSGLPILLASLPLWFFENMILWQIFSLQLLLWGGHTKSQLESNSKIWKELYFFYQQQGKTQNNVFANILL